MRVNYSIIFVSDMSRSVSFYRDVVGMPLKFESTHWTEFATEGATFALHLSEVVDSAGDHSKLEASGSCRPGFQVPSLDEFHQRMTEAGVACSRTPTDVYGSRIANYIDPDGLVFSVSEPPVNPS